MGKLKYILGAIGIIALIAFLTKPSEAVHRSNTEQLLREYIRAGASKYSTEDNSLTAGFAEMIVQSLIGMVVNQHIEVEDYVLFNRSYITKDQERVPLATGVFGYTIFSPKLKDDLDSLLNKSK